MNGLLAAILLTAAAIAGWAQDSGTTPITFSTRDGFRISVYELSGAADSSTAGYLPLSAVSPSFVAPLTVDVENGRHVYQLGASSLFSTRFDLLADGTPQSWRLDAGNPTLHTAGWISLVTGLVVAALGVNDWQSSSPLLFKGSQASLVELSGACISAGGIALILTTRPSASRVR